MGKQKIGTKCLYRKSNCSLSTLSKTCSGASQFLTKSGILRLKKKLPTINYYIENGKIKRDLSIETDKCILRSYYKQKFRKFRHSVNTRDVETIDESARDHNSFGDSILEQHNEKTRLNIDVTSLVVENLKDLLSDWIKKYLVNDTDTKQKIDTVLDSILHKLQLQRNYSSCTYTLDIKVDEEDKFNAKSAKSKPKKCIADGKRSCQTVPVTGKHLKLISTLSIPRNIPKRVISTNSQNPIHANRRIQYKNEFLTISRSSTFLINSSIFNLLSISTKSLTKRCATYDGGEVKTSSKKHEVVLLPKSSYSEILPEQVSLEEVNLDMENKVYPNALELEPVQSLVKSIYAGDPANVTSTERNIYKPQNDNYTMTNSDYIFKNVTTPLHRRKLSWKKAKDTTDLSTTRVTNNRRKNSKPKSLSNGRKLRKIISRKKHTHFYKCVSNKNMCSFHTLGKTRSGDKINDFMRDLKSIVKYLTHHAEGKNIKFDVIIKVFPGIENKILGEPANKKNREKCVCHDSITAAFNVFSRRLLPETKTSSLIVQKHSDATNSLQKSQPNLISILDGAVSQSKYVISEEATNKVTDENSKGKNSISEGSKISTKLEIAKDINELREIIKDLAITTDNYVKEHLDHLKKNKDKDAQGVPDENDNKLNRSKDILRVSTESKYVQISNDKSPIFSGLKLKKDPKKKDRDVHNTGLGKKSTSYNVIESESILKVTDMTSVAADVSTGMVNHKALHFPLAKSKSECEITVGQNKTKLLAYYCDEFIKSRQFIQNRNNCCTCSAHNTCKYVKNLHTHGSCKLFNENSFCNDNEINCEGHQQRSPYDDENCEIGGPVYSCSSIYVDVEDRKKFIVRSRSGMSFLEGLIYCILLWIPVVVICWLIYVYVIKDIIQPQDPAIGRRMLPSQRSSNKSLFHIKLSDLGF